MIYLISGYIFAVVIVHILLFTRATYMSRILLINSAVSCLSIAMLLLAFYFKDINFIDVIFFYIIMSPIGFYGIFLYYKYTKQNNTQAQEKTTTNNNTTNTDVSDYLKC